MGGFLRDGQWVTKDEWENNKKGSFERQESKFRARIEDGAQAKHPVAAGRYHLYVSLACPWAHRTLIVRALLGLEEAISVSVVSPLMFDQGWEFDPSFDEAATEDALFGAQKLYEIYQRANAEHNGRVTVPVLWDKERAEIVNNESREIIEMMATVMRPLWTRQVELYPEDQRAKIDEVMDAIYDPINNGVYRCGFASSQRAYEEAFGQLFEALAYWDERLGQGRYLCGDALTLADVCMFTTLVRFDAVYATHFKCNGKLIAQHEHLSGYLRELYQMSEIRPTVNLHHIKQHYYRSHPGVNPKGIVPVGPFLDLARPHGRG